MPINKTMFLTMYPKFGLETWSLAHGIKISFVFKLFIYYFIHLLFDAMGIKYKNLINFYLSAYVIT